MKIVILGAVFAGFLAISAQAQQGRNPAIEGTIQAQMDAFLRDDYAQAFNYAAPGIQDIFDSSERFGQMVRQGYPMVWRPADVRFLDLRESSGQLWQKVMIRDAEGGLHLLEYEMIESEGKWQIGAVHKVQAPEVGA